MPVRESPREPFGGYPEMGAVHAVIATPELRTAIQEFATIADNVFGRPYLDRMLSTRAAAHDYFDPRNNEAAETAVVSLGYNPARYYRLFDAQRLELSVFDSDVPSQAAIRARRVWERNDVGQVRKEIHDQAGKRLSTEPLRIVCDRVVPTGGIIPRSPREKVRSKLALSLDPSTYDEDVEVLLGEHEVIERVVMRRIKHRQQTDPATSFVPVVPIIGYKPHAAPEQIAEVNGNIDAYLHENPLTLRLGELVTGSSKLVRPKGARD